MPRSNTNQRIDDMAGAMARFIDICVARWAIDGGVPPEIQSEIDTISNILYNCVSVETRNAVATMVQQQQEGG